MEVFTANELRIVTEPEKLLVPQRETSYSECHHLWLFNRMRKAAGGAVDARKEKKNPWYTISGYCLAAVQLGLPLRVGFYRVMTGGQNAPRYLVNPRIISGTGLRPFNGEECLSFPGRKITAWRFDRIRFENLDRKGARVQAEAQGEEARLIQHLLDHMDCVSCQERSEKPPQVGRNEYCPCGSGKKFKKCCEGSPKVLEAA